MPGAATQDHYQPARIRAQLRDLVHLLEAGEITEDEFDLAEDELLDRLAVADQRSALR